MGVLFLFDVSVFAEERLVKDVVLAVHGGTAYARADVTPEFEKLLRQGLEHALRKGYEALQKEGATSLDGVEAAVRELEDDPAFNAGRGAVFTREGTIELDASIMDGKDKRAGAVASVTTIRNPVTAARTVMERSRHVLFVGAGAEKFAADQKLDVVDSEYFQTPRQRDALKRYLERELQSGDRPAGLEKQGEKTESKKSGSTGSSPHGTVGAVARDRAGNLAAATSTGGMNGKRSGRVGDSPVIGAGTYAENASCAVSATGHGEFFIRWTVAHDIAARIKYAGQSLSQAANDVIHGDMEKAGGRGAVIGLNSRGEFTAAWSTKEGLYRGYVTRDGQISVMLYEE
ncbi:MAG: isoaspartyl peptidase/L-asparaginase [Planctomycetaceae bacterium]|nr:isoaspartyl peptidase/L-asparaginase [Planctomycetaceae bacterium]